jgi:hypothetical protein
VHLSYQGGPSGVRFLLIWAPNERTGEEKYFIAYAAPEAPLGLLRRVGFGRWNVEHAIRLSKGEIGLRHFEGRDYTALMRHLTLCLLMLSFVADQAGRLRGEKAGGDGRAGLLRPEAPLLALLGGVAPDQRADVHGGGHRLPPEAQQGRPDLPPAPPGRPAAQIPAHQEAKAKAAPDQTTSETIYHRAVAL